MMSRVLRLLGTLCAVALVAGCGSSKHSSTTSSTTSAAAASPTAAATTPTTTTAANPTASTTVTTATPVTTSTGPRTAPPGTGAPTTTTSSPPAGGATNVRVPATFRIGPGGSLSPPSVSAPAFVAVQVTVASGDGRAHRVVLATPVSHTLSVPADGRASVFLAGQKGGSYALEVDGARRGMLIIGGEPGP